MAKATVQHKRSKVYVGNPGVSKTFHMGIHPNSQAPYQVDLQSHKIPLGETTH